jgi:competence protein ComEC
MQKGQNPAGRYGQIAFSAAALGCALGFSCTLGLEKTAFGLETTSIAAIEGRLCEDLRLNGYGGGSVSIELDSVYSKPDYHGRSVKADAAGKLFVSYNKKTLPLAKEVGRGTQVKMTGLCSNGNGSLRFRADTLHIVEEAPRIERLRSGFRMGLSRFFADYQWGGLSLALLVGSRDLLEGELSAAYREAGCSHVLALSGMHLAIISAIIAFLLRKPLGLKPASVAGALLIAAYVYLSGGQPSLVRAMLMYFIGTLALLAGFKGGGIPALCAAFLLQLAIGPADAGSAGFILSYLALAGILFFAEDIDYLLRGLLPRFLSGGFAASIGAMLATAAISAGLFGKIYPIGIVSSLILTPLTTIFMVLSIFFPLLMLIAPPLAFIFDVVMSFLYTVLKMLAEICSLVPGIECSPLSALLVSFLLIALLLIAKKRAMQYYNRIDAFDTDKLQL